MADYRDHDAAHSNAMLGEADEEGVLGTSLTTRQIEAFGKKVTATASQLIGDASDPHYPSAMTSLTKQMKRPTIQRGVLSFAQTTPTDLVRSKLSTSEISHRAITRLPDELLRNLPEDSNTYSLFQGFQASLPDGESDHRKSHRRRTSRGQKLLGGSSPGDDGPPSLEGLKKDRNAMNHRLEMMGIRKNLCSTEIHEIDSKISNLNTMRKIVLDRLADLENDEDHLERDLLDLDVKIDNAQEALEDAAALDPSTARNNDEDDEDDDEPDASAPGFMSESIYAQLPNASSPSKRRPKPPRRKSMPVLHEHLTSGSNIRTIPAHTDSITALDFDLPFGTLVTAALDDTVRVWDLNLGRCMGFLEGHTASVRCLQVEETLVATGSSDASIRLWDLSRAHYEPSEHRTANSSPPGSDDGLGFENPDEDAPPPPPSSAMADCPLYVLDAHVAEVTALHLRGDTLVSGSADKTLRQWDLARGRCVQTLDVLWAAAQAAATLDRGPPASTGIGSSTPDPTGSAAGLWKTPSSASRMGMSGSGVGANADFVGALQSFEAALACGTADGMVRLWDLRSGQVHRSLVGHTGPVTALQFDETHLVTGSEDRSVRIWDLRTGAIHDAYAYPLPITALMFDARRIVAAAGEDVTKVYDKTDGRHWDCGAGAQVDEMGEKEGKAGVVERVRIKDGYMVEGRKDGVVGVWTC